MRRRPVRQRAAVSAEHASAPRIKVCRLANCAGFNAFTTDGNNVATLTRCLVISSVKGAPGKRDSRFAMQSVAPAPKASAMSQIEMSKLKEENCSTRSEELR